ARGAGETLRDDGRAAPGAARRPPDRRAGPRGDARADRVQGPAGHRRPRPLPPFGEIVRDEAEESATTIMTDLDTLARELLAGSTRALARGLTWVEAGGERAEALVARVYPRTGRADGVDLLDAAGRDLILVETVGVGQDEVDVMRLAHTVVVVSVPGLGDDVQALKAGLLEIADLHVVNKTDREGADRTLAELRSMLTLLPPVESPAGPDGAPAGEPWVPPVLGASAAREEGIEALMDALDGHMAYLKTSGELDRRWRRMVGA